ncbi:MAG: glycosyltransferase family 39 protein [Alphaproteobacteria bacterium]|nr:MAG: glycosyltransferase family 39 protein [Alphaproteobacteria bacterium]
MRSWWKTMSRSGRRFYALCALLTLASLWLYGAGHARYGLFDVDESIFTQATIEMRASGKVSMPTYNEEPRYHKPPLFYWVQDASMSLLGENSLYAARLPSILGALGTILLLGWGVARLTGSRRWGLMSAMVMALNLSFLVVGRAATADGLLNLTSLALTLWVVHVCFPGAAVLAKNDHGQVDAGVFSARLRKVAARSLAQRRQWLVTGVLAGIGFLAKGPIAWLPALVIVGVLWLVRKDRQDLVRRLSPVKSGLLALAMLVPWMGLLLVQHGLGFFYEFFVVQNVNRYAGSMGNSQSGSSLYYLGVLLFGFFPWVFMLPKAVRLTTKGGIRRVRRALQGEDAGRALPVVACLWALVYIGFFSFSQTKLAHYIVPAYPALAILVGAVLAQVPRVKVPMVASVLGGVFGLLLGVLMLALNPLLQGLRSDHLTGWLGWLQAAFDFEWPIKDEIARAVLSQPVLLDAAPMVIGVLMVLAVVPAWVLVSRAIKGGVIVLALSWAICLGLIAWGVVPVVWRYTQAPLADMARVIGEAPVTTPIIHLGVHKPSVLYLSGRHFLKLEKPLQLPDYLTAPETLVLLEQDNVLPVVREVGIHGGAQVLGQRCNAGYCLLNIARVGLPGDVRR